MEKRKTEKRENYQFARILRGRTPKDFESLSDDPDTLVSWVVGGSDIPKLLSLLPESSESASSSTTKTGLGNSALPLLLHIGHDRPWLAKKLGLGFQFKLCLFSPRSAASESETTKNSNEPQLANWDGVFEVTNIAYPAQWHFIAPHQQSLKTKSLREIQSNFSLFNIEQVNLQGEKSNPNYMTPDRFSSVMNSDSSNTLTEHQKLAYARAFLWHEVGLTGLYGGRGFTVNENGKRGSKEYLIKNCKLSDVDFELIDLPIDISHLEL